MAEPAPARVAEPAIDDRALALAVVADQGYRLPNSAPGLEVPDRVGGGKGILFGRESLESREDLALAPLPIADLRPGEQSL
jgi:hypothetical protein